MITKIKPTKPASLKVVNISSKLAKTSLGKKTDSSIAIRIKIRPTVILAKYNQQTLIGIKKSFFIGNFLY